MYRTKAKYCQGLQPISHHHLQHIIIITIISFTCYGLNRPVSASSNSLYKGLPRRLRPYGLQFSIIFYILLLFILVTCRSQSDLYLLSFSSAGSAFKSSNNFPYSLWSKRVHPAVLRKNFISNDVKPFVSFFFIRIQISLSYKRMRRASELYTFILQNFWAKDGLKVLFRIPSIRENVVTFGRILFSFSLDISQPRY